MSFRLIAPTGGAAPPKRSSAVFVHYSGDLYLFGGMGKSRYNDMWKFNLQSETWTEVTPSSSVIPTPRAKIAGTVHGESLYVYGGWTQQGKVGELYRFHFPTRAWTLVSATGSAGSPPLRSSTFCTVVAIPSKGGKRRKRRSGGSKKVVVKAAPPPASADAPPPASSEGSESSSSSESSPVKTPRKRMNARLLMWGGIGANKYNDAYMFNFRNRSWASISQSEPPGKRSSYGGIFQHRGKLHIICGLGSGRYGDSHVGALKNAGRAIEWTKMKYSRGGEDEAVSASSASRGRGRRGRGRGLGSSSARKTPIPLPRGRHSAAYFAGGVFLFGGWMNAGKTDEFWRLDLDEASWRRFPKRKGLVWPSKREGQGAVVVGSMMYMFGGWVEIAEGTSSNELFVIDLAELTK